MSKNTIICNTTPPYQVVATGNGFGASTTTINVTGITTSNIQLIVAAVASGSTTTITDSKGNVYSGLPIAGSIIVKIFYMLQPVVGPTMSFTLTSPNLSAAVYIVQGPNPPIPAFDTQNNNGAFSGGSTTNTGNITPAFNGDFILAAASTGTGTTGTASTISGWTLTNLPFRAGVAQGLIVYYQSQQYRSTVSITFSAGAGSTLNVFGASIGAWSN